MGAVTQRGRTPIVQYPVQGDPYVTFWLKKVPLYLPPKKKSPGCADPIPAHPPDKVAPYWWYHIGQATQAASQACTGSASVHCALQT